ncbi:MAG: OsmC family protein [Chloroflexaceae bacterium]|nr:OsmC family protein [Chloroflexaceae bacterium]NJL33216.1 OsmC family protein [Chloroflexaceae bacterium]NJO05509.1 OsmC family protein [Chloroflexaceae bacterium]
MATRLASNGIIGLSSFPTISTCSIRKRPSQNCIRSTVVAELLRHALGTWTGDLRSGSGQLSTSSGVLNDLSYTFATRFENTRGTNPEELIAAAHASCFSMALAHGLSQAGHVPERITTQATVVLDGLKITRIHLTTEGVVPGIDQATFQAAAEDTKVNCPVSVLLTPGLEEVTLTATLQ